MQDYILNGQGYGPLGQALAGVRFDPYLLRPYIETDPTDPYRGRPCAEMQVGWVHNQDTGEVTPKRKKFLIRDLEERGIRSPVFNATTLTKDAWIQLDAAAEMPYRVPLRLYADLRAAKTFGGFDAWSKLTYEYQALGDSGEAVVDMDATSEGRADRPLADIKSVPLPITHSDFYFSQRELDVARNTAMPLDTTMVEQASRRIGETVEQTALGTVTGMTYGTRSAGPFPHTGTSTVYGLTNFPYRTLYHTLATPTGSNPDAVLANVLAMIELMQTNAYFGPYTLYVSTGFTQFLNNDYFRSGSTSAVRSLRERLLQIEGITDIRRLNYLTTGYRMILVDYNTGQFGAINGMEPRTVQWPERGGLLQKFVRMAIQVPLLRAPQSGIAAIVDATTT